MAMFFAILKGDRHEEDLIDLTLSWYLVSNMDIAWTESICGQMAGRTQLESLEAT